jgi:hypothetical protein
MVHGAALVLWLDAQLLINAMQHTAGKILCLAFILKPPN